ncbi:MAG: hypothetical protein R3A79_12995 [Nannocystaceae bacterium]
MDLHIPLTCSVDGEAAALSHDSTRIATVRQTWEIDLDDEENVSFEIADFQQGGVTYTVAAQSSLEGGDWVAWPRSSAAAVSPQISDTGTLEIEIVATPAGSQAAAAGTTATTVLRRPGRPDKLRN